MTDQDHGVAFTLADRRCLSMMMTTAAAKGWTATGSTGLEGFAELLRLYPPSSTTAAHVLARLDEGTIAILDQSSLKVVGRFGSLMEALGAVSRIVGEQTWRSAPMPYSPMF